MNKTRIELLSDGVFAIVMTLLIIEIKVPDLELEHTSNAVLWFELKHLGPLFLSYFVSFTVLAMYWFSHHAMFHSFSKNIDRGLMYLNMIFLMLISIIPFSANLIGTYPNSEPGVIVYGTNLILLGVIMLIMFYYVITREHILNSSLSVKTIKQARIRLFLTPIFAFFGILSSYLSIPLSLFLFAFPIIFNIIPGTLNTLEKIFKFEI